MPFVSDKQRRYLWSQKPEVAKKFAEHKNTGGDIKALGGPYRGDFMGKYAKDNWNTPSGSWLGKRRVKEWQDIKKEIPTLGKKTGSSYIHIDPYTGQGGPHFQGHKPGYEQYDYVNVPAQGQGHFSDWFKPVIDLHEYGHARSSRDPYSASNDYGSPAGQLHEEAYASRLARDDADWELSDNENQLLEDALGTYAQDAFQNYGSHLPAPKYNQFDEDKRGWYNTQEQLRPGWFQNPYRYKEWVGPRDEVAKDYADYWYENPLRGARHHPADAGSDIQAVDVWHAFRPPAGKDIGMGKTTGRDNMYRVYGDKDAPFPTEFPVSRNRPDVKRARDAAIKRREDAAKKEKYEKSLKEWQTAGDKHRAEWEKARPDRIQESLANHPYGKPEMIPGETIENYTARWDDWRDEVLKSTDAVKYPGYDVPKPKDPFAAPLSGKKKKKKKKSGGGFLDKLFGN